MELSDKYPSGPCPCEHKLKKKVDNTCFVPYEMVDLEKVNTAGSQSRRLEASQSITRVYSAPHIDNQSAFYVTDGNNDEDTKSVDPTAPSYTNQDDSSSQQDLENGSQVAELQKAQTAKSQRSERDPKLVSQGCTGKWPHTYVYTSGCVERDRRS